MRRAERERFDSLLEQVLATMPPAIHRMIEETPVIVEDHPSPELLRELGMNPDEETLCGLHSGVPLTERSSGHTELPDVVTLYREGILEEAGGWEPWVDEDGTARGGTDAVQREIRITLLHEIGHHYGLNEEDLERLGFA